MKKIVGTVRDLAERFDSLYEYVYSKHFIDEDNYIRLSEILGILGYELAPEDRKYEGEYGDIKAYYGCFVCKKNDDEMDDKELNRYFKVKFENANTNDISDIWELICDEDLLLVNRKNGKEVEDIEYNHDKNMVEYRYEYSDYSILVPLSNVYKNLKVINRR